MRRRRKRTSEVIPFSSPPKGIIILWLWTSAKLCTCMCVCVCGIPNQCISYSQLCSLIFSSNQHLVKSWPHIYSLKGTTYFTVFPQMAREAVCCCVAPLTNMLYGSWWGSCFLWGINPLYAVFAMDTLMRYKKEWQRNTNIPINMLTHFLTVYRILYKPNHLFLLAEWM